jgi:hypothetical protein
MLAATPGNFALLSTAAHATELGFSLTALAMVKSIFIQPMLTTSD